VKRQALIRELHEAGCVLMRHGARHDVSVNPATGQKQPVPRHTEIDDALVKHIQKYLGLKGVDGSADRSASSDP
jgi:mRNA interferase HicA